MHGAVVTVQINFLGGNNMTLFIGVNKWLFPSRHCEKFEGVNLNEVWNTELRLTTSNFEQGVKEWPLLHFWKCEVIRFEGSIYSHQWSNFAQNEVKYFRVYFELLFSAVINVFVLTTEGGTSRETCARHVRRAISPASLNLEGYKLAWANPCPNPGHSPIFSQIGQEMPEKSPIY